MYNLKIRCKIKPLSWPYITAKCKKLIYFLFKSIFTHKDTGLDTRSFGQKIN